MMTFFIAACVCAVYFGVTLDYSMRAAEAGGNTVAAMLLKTFGLLIPVLACGAYQYWKLVQSGVTGSRLWWTVIGTAVGAPIAGVVLMLIVVFALFSKQP